MENYITENEVWKDIKGYEGLYQVSNFGRVKSVERIVTYGDRHHTVKEKMKKPTLKKRRNKAGGKYVDDGYLVVALYKNNKAKMEYVHRLVAEAFIPNPENKETVNHIDGNKQNNQVSNLEWSTYTENNYHAFETGLNDIDNALKAGLEKAMTVQQFDENMNLIAEYPSMREAERKNNMANGSISKAIKKGWKSHGYYWKIKNNN